MGQVPTQLNLGLGMVVHTFNPNSKAKQISKFKASLRNDVALSEL